MSFHTDFADWLVGSFRLPVRVRSLARTEGAASPNSSRKALSIVKRSALLASFVMSIL